MGQMKVSAAQPTLGIAQSHTQQQLPAPGQSTALTVKLYSSCHIVTASVLSTLTPNACCINLQHQATHLPSQLRKDVHAGAGADLLRSWFAGFLRSREIAEIDKVIQNEQGGGSSKANSGQQDSTERPMGPLQVCPYLCQHQPSTCLVAVNYARSHSPSSVVLL
jgi:hypothetical protein